VRAIFDHISIVDDASGTEHGVVEVVHRSGRVSRQTAERASGHPGNPLSEEGWLTGQRWTDVSGLGVTTGRCSARRPPQG
jgi:hypothetical protein